MGEAFDSLAPPEPKRLTVRLEQGEDWLRLVSVKRDWLGAAFLIFWLTGWTFGCVLLAGLVIAQFSFFTLLFAIPFWAAELFVFSLVGTMIASREEVLLDSQGLAYRWTVWGWPISRRRVPLSEIVRVESSFLAPRSSKRQLDSVPASSYRLTVETIGQPLQIPAGRSGEEQAWLERTFENMLAALKRLHAPIERDDGNEPSPMPIPQELPAVLELRPPAGAAVSRPSETTWQYAYDFDAIRLSERGRLNLPTLGFLLFINAFWNGITGVFVVQLWGFAAPGVNMKPVPHGWAWFGEFLFLLPFEVIGLVMFAALIAVVLEPIRRSCWTLGRSAVSYRLSYLGIGKTSAYEIRQLDRLELRRRGAKRDESEADSDCAGNNEVRFDLALVDSSGKDLCEIERLSLGEACWIADVILRERTGWFAAA